MNTTHLNGHWTYRSFNNSTSIVGDDGKKALALIFGEGNLKISVQKKNPHLFSAVLDFGGDAAMDLYGEIVSGSGVSPTTVIITGTGREGTSTAKWVYQYKGYVVPQWAEGVQQVSAIVGTVIRTIPHSAGDVNNPKKQSPAGVVASFTMLKH